MMSEAEFLSAIQEYIEDTQTTLDAEYGLGRSVNELIEDCAMPKLYAEVLQRIEALNNERS